MFVKAFITEVEKRHLYLGEYTTRVVADALVSQGMILRSDIFELYPLLVYWGYALETADVTDMRSFYTAITVYRTTPPRVNPLTGKHELSPKRDAAGAAYSATVNRWNKVINPAIEQLWLNPVREKVFSGFKDLFRMSRDKNPLTLGQSGSVISHVAVLYKMQNYVLDLADSEDARLAELKELRNEGATKFPLMV